MDTRDVERRIRGMVESRVGSGSSAFTRQQELMAAVFPRTSGKDMISEDVFRSSMGSLGFKMSRSQSASLYNKYKKGGGEALDVGHFTRMVMDPGQPSRRKRAQTAHSSKRRPSSRGSSAPWDTTGQDYGHGQETILQARPHSAAVTSGPLTLGRVKTIITDPS